MSKAQVQPQIKKDWVNTGRRREESLDSFIKIVKALMSYPQTIKQLTEMTGLCDKTIRRYIKVMSCHFLIQEFGEENNRWNPPQYYIKKLF